MTAAELYEQKRILTEELAAMPPNRSKAYRQKLVEFAAIHYKIRRFEKARRDAIDCLGL